VCVGVWACGRVCARAHLSLGLLLLCSISARKGSDGREALMDCMDVAMSCIQ
jgi:hypothetical protein